MANPSLLLVLAGFVSLSIAQEDASFQSDDGPILRDDIDPDSTLLTIISLLPQNRVDRQDSPSDPTMQEEGMDRRRPGPRPRPRPGPRPRPHPRPPIERCGNWSAWQDLKCWWPNMDMKSMPEACSYIPTRSQWPDYLKKFVEAKATEMYAVIQTEYKKRGAPPKCGFCSRSFQCRMRNETGEEAVATDSGSMGGDDGMDEMGRGRGGHGRRRQQQCPLKEIRPLKGEDCDDSKACQISLENGGCPPPLFLGGGKIKRIRDAIDQGDDESVMDEIYNAQFDDAASVYSSDFSDYALDGDARKKRQSGFGGFQDYNDFGESGDDIGMNRQYDWSGGRRQMTVRFPEDGRGQGPQQGQQGGFNQRMSEMPFGFGQGGQQFGPAGRGQQQQQQFPPGGRDQRQQQFGPPHPFGPDAGGRGGFGPDQSGRDDFAPTGFDPSRQGRGKFGPGRRGQGGFGPGPRRGDDPWDDDIYEDDYYDGGDYYDDDDYDMEGEMSRFGPGGRGRGRFPPRPFPGRRGRGGRGRFPPGRWDPSGRGRHRRYPPMPPRHRHHFRPGGRDRRHHRFPPPPYFPHRRHHRGGRGPWGSEEDSSYEDGPDFGNFGSFGDRMPRQQQGQSNPMTFAIFTPAFMNSSMGMDQQESQSFRQMSPGGRGSRGDHNRRGKMDFMANLLRGTTCVSNGKQCLCCCGHYIPNVDTGNCQSIIGMLPGIDGVFERLTQTIDDSGNADSLVQFTDSQPNF